jgi:RND family efflux transporter MFP subunit
MKSIYYKSIAVVLSFFVIACSQPTDKKAELAQLTKQRDELNVKIQKLQTELASTDSTLAKKVREVSIMEVKYSTFQHYIEVQGRLDGEENVDVYPEAMGVVEAVNVVSGQRVAKGQVLARINDAAVREQLKGLETQYQFAKETFEKQERLWNQKIGSEMQYLQAKTQKEGLESQLAATRKQLDMMAIKSPINGTVEEVGVKLGQTASPQLPAFRVLNFSSLKVKADVAEAYSNRINVGDDVLVYFPDLEKETPAKITAASRYINPINRTFQVEVRLNGAAEGYKANMVAVLKINDYKANNATVIPVNFIQTDPNGSFVYVAENKGKETVASKAFIKQGQSYNGMIEITEGLKPGDKVISTNYLELEEGEALKL